MQFHKITTLLYQRIICYLKPNAYFLHTYAPHPSILITLPNRVQYINSLLNQLIRQQSFDLKDKLQKYEISVPQQLMRSRQNESKRSINSIDGITFDETTSFIQINSAGKLDITKNYTNFNAVFAVILYSNVQNSKIIRFHKRNFQLGVVIAKILALTSIIWATYELQYSTRLENHKKQ